MYVSLQDTKNVIIYQKDQPARWCELQRGRYYLRETIDHPEHIFNRSVVSLATLTHAKSDLSPFNRYVRTPTPTFFTLTGPLHASSCSCLLPTYIALLRGGVDEILQPINVRHLNTLFAVHVWPRYSVCVCADSLQGNLAFKGEMMTQIINAARDSNELLDFKTILRANRRPNRPPVAESGHHTKTRTHKALLVSLGIIPADIAGSEDTSIYFALAKELLTRLDSFGLSHKIATDFDG